MDKINHTTKKNKFDGSIVFGTKFFNQKTGRLNHITNAVKAQQAYFIDPKTGLLYEHMKEKRDCSVCGLSESRALFLKNGFRHVRCSCGFIYVNPIASDKYREHFFSEIYKTWTDVLLSPEQETVDKRKFQYGLEFIDGYAKSKGFLVDIGAGSGLFLKLARDAGWKVSAVEFNRKAARNIKKLGIEVFDKPLEKGIYEPESVDVVTAWEVLEHINHPNAFIKQIHKILKIGGLLFICVPNIDALVTRILHEKSNTFGGSSHVNFFNIETLSRLLRKNGFRILKADTAISELGSIKNYLCYEDAYLGSADLKLDFLRPEFLYAHNLGSRIFMLARKKL